MNQGLKGIVARTVGTVTPFGRREEMMGLKASPPHIVSILHRTDFSWDGVEACLIDGLPLDGADNIYAILHVRGMDRGKEMVGTA